MIRTVADLLLQLIEREKEVLSGIGVVHAPTIGEMYEGLARAVLDHAIPGEYGLRWISGFVRSSEGLSRQIDCMLVRGAGEPIPHTGKEIHGLDNVIAVVEIKKSLRSSEMLDAWENLASVTALYRNDAEDAQNNRVSIEPLLHTFSSITGKVFRARGTGEGLTPLDRMIAHCLHFDLSCPVRVAFGFDGYKTERGLREAFYTCLERMPNKSGIPYLPNIASSGGYSICKLTGFPYSSRVEDGWWRVVGSTDANPLTLLIEHIFYRLSLSSSTRKYLGLDLDLEPFSQVLAAKFHDTDLGAGWEYSFSDVREKQLRSRSAAGSWAPVEIDQDTAIFLQLLAKYGSASLSDQFLIAAATRASLTPFEFANRLVAKRLALFDDSRVVPAHENSAVVIQSDGTWVAGNADDHRLKNWVLFRGESGPSS